MRLVCSGTVSLVCDDGGCYGVQLAQEEAQVVQVGTRTVNGKRLGCEVQKVPDFASGDAAKQGRDGVAFVLVERKYPRMNSGLIHKTR